GIADRQEDRLVLSPGPRQGLRPPRVPVDRVGGVLQEVRARLGGESIGHERPSVSPRGARCPEPHLPYWSSPCRWAPRKLDPLPEQGRTGSSPPAGTGTGIIDPRPRSIDRVSGSAWGRSPHQLLHTTDRLSGCPARRLTVPGVASGGLETSTVPAASVICAAGSLAIWHPSRPGLRVAVTMVPREPAAPPHGSALSVTSSGAQARDEPDGSPLGEAEGPLPTPWSGGPESTTAATATARTPATAAPAKSPP